MPVMRVIAVDLDGTLVKSDTLFENFILFIRKYPFRIFRVFLWLSKGKANLKRRLADHLMPKAHNLPYNQEVLAWLKQEKAKGATLVLATAADQRIADSIAQELAIFDTVIGTKENNLAAANKQSALNTAYGTGNYEYMGNSKADLQVWKSASICHVVNPGLGVLAAVKKQGRLGMVFDNRPSGPKTVSKSLRLHQWAKNSLLFVPLLAAHKFSDPNLILLGLLAFLIFGACASSVYLLNDVLDIESDREHPSKKFRPLAAGTMSITVALGLIPLLLLLAFATSILFLPLLFTACLGVYFVVTFAYSFWLKGMVMVDVVVLSLLYTLRVIAGTAVFALSTTFWMLAFCIFIFLSLAFVKRYTELRQDRQLGKTGKTAGRGYYPADFELLASLGASAGYLAVLVLALFINDQTSLHLYKTPQLLWATCPLLLFWISRVWLLAHRGLMHDDPILFAIKDNVSRLVGLLFCMLFIAAVVWPIQY